MTSGMHNRPKLIAASLLTTLALLLVGHSILNLDPLSEQVTQRAQNETLQQTGTHGSPEKGIAESHSSFDPTLDDSRLRFSEGEIYAGTGRNIFSMQIEDHTEIHRVQPRPSPTDPTIRLSSPSFGLKFFGFATWTNSPRTVFLSLDNDIFVGNEGDIVDRRYRIIRIAPESVDVEDLFDDSPHTIALQQG